MVELEPDKRIVRNDSSVLAGLLFKCVMGSFGVSLPMVGIVQEESKGGKSIRVGLLGLS